MKLNCPAAAELFELCSMGLRLPDAVLAAALSSGEFAAALDESLAALDLGPLGGGAEGGARARLACYEGADPAGLLHRVRAEYTRLFVGAPRPEVSPFAGVYQAERAGVTPVLYVSREAMEVERFMSRCGMGRPEGTNEPLDHIAAELEFLEYLSLDASGSLPREGRTPVPEGSLERFFSERFAPFAREFAPRVVQATQEPLYVVLSEALLLMVGVE